MASSPENTNAQSRAINALDNDATACRFKLARFSTVKLPTSFMLGRDNPSNVAIQDITNQVATAPAIDTPTAKHPRRRLLTVIPASKELFVRQKSTSDDLSS